MEESAAGSKSQCCSSSVEQTADRSHHHHQGNSGTVLVQLCFSTCVYINYKMHTLWLHQKAKLTLQKAVQKIPTRHSTLTIV